MTLVCSKEHAGPSQVERSRPCPAPVEAAAVKDWHDAQRRWRIFQAGVRGGGEEGGRGV